MNKILVHWVPPGIIVIQSLLTFPLVRETLGISESFGWQIFISAALALLFVANHLYSISRPYNRFLRFDTTKGTLLEHFANQMREPYKGDDIELRVNVMLKKTKVFPGLEPSPSIRSRAVPRCLVPTWRSENMDHHGDRDLIFTINQGVSGEAFQLGEATFADLTVAKPKSYNLNLDQIEKTSDLTFVVSLPIRKIDLKTMRFSNEIIGVVNVDSRTPGAEVLINDNEKYKDLRDRTLRFAKFCSLLF